MKIEELIIDGFKSYAVRTTIDKWDPTFNAITVHIPLSHIAGS
jgi:structural maintenance of chromosome 2